MRSILRFLIGAAACGLLLTTANGQVVAAGPENVQRVLVLPFDVHAAGDLGFLRDGVLDMLSTRLDIPGKAEPIPAAKVREAIASMPQPISQNAAVLLGVSLGARYVVHGSLTVIGDNISTDARLLDVTSSQPVVVFNQAGRSQGDAIQHVNQFAARIATEIFGQPGAVAAAAAPAPAAVQGEAGLDRRAHPEKVFAKAFNTGGGEMEDTYGEPEGSRRLTTPIWRSRRFKTAIRGLAVGDVDGDGRNETVFIDERTVHVYRNAEGAFTPVAEITGTPNEDFLAVDVADINGNGQAEIFVNSISNINGWAASFVLEWTGSGFERIVRDETRFLRVVPVPGRGPVLFGQNQGREDNFSGAPYEMAWQGAAYEPVDGISLPPGVTVFGFAMGDIMEPDARAFAAFNESDVLRLLDAEGVEEWRSEDPVGGTMVYLEPPAWVSAPAKDRRIMDTEMALKRFYIPQRLHVLDTDEDGRDELLTVNNIDRTGNILKRMRVFKSGRVRALGWEKVGLYPRWQSRRVSGHMADLAVADFDNDGTVEIVMPVVSRSAFLGTDARSFIMAQDLP